jgi:hypothetical protein
VLNFSDADPDPKSGVFLTPESRMGKKSKSGSRMNLLDHISESSKTIFCIEILKILLCGSGNLFDHGSGMEKNSDPGKTYRIRNTA